MMNLMKSPQERASMLQTSEPVVEKIPCHRHAQDHDDSSTKLQQGDPRSARNREAKVEERANMQPIPESVEDREESYRYRYVDRPEQSRTHSRGDRGRARGKQ